MEVHEMKGKGWIKWNNKASMEKNNKFLNMYDMEFKPIGRDEGENSIKDH